MSSARTEVEHKNNMARKTSEWEAFIVANPVKAS
jgi:hypothetical protein|tara:strand:- start:171 stop:272 length:102 start_codon:yes stop_codon:yes gene_type:complete